MCTPNTPNTPNTPRRLVNNIFMGLACVVFGIMDLCKGLWNKLRGKNE